jgi:hypothetical protein
MDATRHFSLRVDSYDGRGTHIWCGDGQREFIYVLGAWTQKGMPKFSTVAIGILKKRFRLGRKSAHGGS